MMSSMISNAIFFAFRCSDIGSTFLDSSSKVMSVNVGAGMFAKLSGVNSLPSTGVKLKSVGNGISCISGSGMFVIRWGASWAVTVGWLNAERCSGAMRMRVWI